MEFLLPASPFAGLLLVVAGNALRANRKNDPSCLGHVLVSANEMTVAETVLHRSGAAIFVVGVVLNIFL